jgi:phosphotransferase family enzyme/methyltransferase family protein
MLDITLATEFLPGTNLKGQVAGANWSFLLPSMEQNQIVCVGVPPPAALKTLLRLSQSVVVVCERPQQLQELEEIRQKRGLENVRSVATGRLPLDDRSVDLVFLADGATLLLRDHMLAAEIKRLLKPEGLIYFEVGGALTGGSLPMPLDGFGAPQRFWVTPLRGEVQTAVPAGDQTTIDYFLRHSLYSPSLKLQPFKRAARFLNRRLAANRLTRRSSVLVSWPGQGPGELLPGYLRSVARDAGVGVDDYRWGLVARGRYSSRKVLFYLFDHASKAPTYIVKMTRDSALNPRLENECRALTLLNEKGLGAGETLPQVVFSGQHSGLAIVGQTIVDGTPFRNRTDGSANCRYLRSALDWLVDLGAATADRAAATPLQVAEGLELLFRRFAQIYELTPAHRDFLAEQIAAIAGSRGTIPLVFQHGDPGTWNIMATPAGRAAFLDWEAFEECGMPLWDLFYFMRSYSVWSARKAGVRDSLKGFAQQLLTESALGTLLAEVVGRYCERSGLAQNLVQPLFYTCWMHRALKESTRLPAERLERGHYVSLLRMCIDRQGEPTLRRLFALHGTCS